MGNRACGNPATLVAPTFCAGRLAFASTIQSREGVKTHDDTQDRDTRGVAVSAAQAARRQKELTPSDPDGPYGDCVGDRQRRGVLGLRRSVLHHWSRDTR